MKFIENSKILFPQPEEFEGGERNKSNNSLPNTLGVFCATFFSREKLLRLKTSVVV